MHEPGQVITSFAQLLRSVEQGTAKVAIAAAGDLEALEALRDASRLGLARGVLVGDLERIRKLADFLQLDLSQHDLVHEEDPDRAADGAVEAVTSGQAGLLMKGNLATSQLLRAVLDRRYGLRTARPLSHVGVLELKEQKRLILVTDGGVNILPDVSRKAQIIQNAVYVAHGLGIKQPRVAILAAIEVVNPEMQATVDAAMLAKMADRGQLNGAIIDGPLALDVAISQEASEHKGLNSPVGGQADILVAPNIEAGNILLKSIQYFAGAALAGVVVGARVPLILLSRADRAEGKLLSMALAKRLAEN